MAGTHPADAPAPLTLTATRLAARSPWMAFRIEGDGQPSPEPTGAFGGFRYGSVLEPDIMACSTVRPSDCPVSR
jgi:hypothetical protein